MIFTILDKKQAKRNNIDYRYLQESGLWVLKPEYISDFLTNDTKPSALNYVVDELQNNDSILQQQDEASITSGSGKRKARQSSPKKEKRARR